MPALTVEALPGVHLLPVLHDRLEVAAAVRAALAELDPAGVAVELPTTLAEAAERAVARLPAVSVVISQEPGEEALVWAVAPGDPVAEALRWARERQRPRFLVDPDLPYPERHPDPVPDPYALWHLGAARFLSLVARAAGERPAGEADRRRETGMAHHVRQAREALGEGHLLVLVGAAHLHRLAAALAGPTAVPFARVRRSQVEVRHLHPESLTALLPDPPLAHAAYELLRSGPLPPQPELEETAARRLSLVRAGLRLIHREPEGEGNDRRRRVAAYAAHRAARTGSGLAACPDRWALARVAWAVAARSYAEQTRETAAPWQRRLFLDFAYRYARRQGLLVPGLYEWVVAARGVGDDNLAWEVFEAARTYPWQQEAAELATARIDGDELDLGTRKIRFRRRFFRVKQRPVAIPVQRARREEDPESWLGGFLTGGGLCSYPPEDLVVEDYGRFLKAKAAGLLKAERSSSEPFTVSLLDGIDLRETLRRRLDDGRIWVRELGRAPGRAGAVVAIFDRDLAEPPCYPYLMTWLGEHGQESDMAFYSTQPAEQVVGPGIMRATYGGFLMTMPPGRLADVWLDPDYGGAREKAEVLVMAAVDYSPEKLVVHAAAEPPAPRLGRYAAARGKRLVHVPLGTLSPVTLKKIRVLHVLAGHDKRALARDYVW